jgi:hypothetical protein
VFSAEFAPAAALIARARALAARFSDPAMDATVLIEASVLDVYQGVSPAVVLATLDRAELLAQRADDRWLVDRVHGNRGAGPRWRLGDLEGYRADARRAVEIAESADWPVWIARTCNFLAKACLLLGD